MPDIELRFQRDMLVLSAPVDAALARQGINAPRDRQYLNLMEPDAIRDVLRFEEMAGAHCLVTPTEDITRARLAHLNMDDDPSRLARAALDIVNDLRPQHVLAEIGPCGLPLDPSSKSSLNENRGQYADAARSFGEGAFDAFFLNGFTSIVDLKCALMGVAQVSGKPVFASVMLGSSSDTSPDALSGNGAKDDGGSDGFSRGGMRKVQGAELSYPFASAGFSFVDDMPAPPRTAAQRTELDPGKWPEALDAMADLGAAVVGFEAAGSIAEAVAYAHVATQRVSLPVLAQLRVPEGSESESAAAKGLVPLSDIDAYTPDTMGTAAVKLYGAGVQFLRATGAATSAYTGALAATVQGLDVRRREKGGR